MTRRRKTRQFALRSSLGSWSAGACLASATVAHRHAHTPHRATALFWVWLLAAQESSSSIGMLTECTGTAAQWLLTLIFSQPCRRASSPGGSRWTGSRANRPRSSRWCRSRGPVLPSWGRQVRENWRASSMPTSILRSIFWPFSWPWRTRVEFADTRSRLVLGVTKGALSDGTLGGS